MRACQLPGIWSRKGAKLAERMGTIDASSIFLGFRKKRSSKKKPPSLQSTATSVALSSRSRDHNVSVRMVRSMFHFRSFLLPLIALLLLGQDLRTLPEETKKPSIFLKTSLADQ